MSERTTERVPREEALATVGSALTAVGLAVWMAGPMGELCLDDGYIHLAYATSLRRGEGLSYNPHDWELGATSPLWVLVLALSPAVSVFWAKAIGIALHGASAGVTTRVASALLPDARPRARALGGLVAGLLIASHPLLLQGAISGMEISLTVVLLAGCALATIRERWPWAIALGALGVLARPEAAAFAVALTLVATARARERRAVAPALGALIGTGLLVAYCLAAGGQPMPNTFYVKARATLGASLEYLSLRVAPTEAWLITGLGLLLLGYLCAQELHARRRLVPGLALAWLGCVVAIAVSRRLETEVDFYFLRYFAIVAFVPPALLGVAVARHPRGAFALVPALILLAVLVPERRALARAQEEDIRLLNHEPAREIAETFPPDARVLVEGAGAIRFFTPRSMTIIDVIGLNDRRIARTPRAQWACALLARSPTHAALPSMLVPRVMAVFRMSPISSHRDRAFSQVLPPIELSLDLFRVLAPQPEALERCQRALLD
ncbi:MAG: hypothetical protein U0234_22670 [Sandaracinus sp.]